MKEIIAIVRPHLAEKILDGLKHAPLEAIQVREVKGFGRQKGSLERYADNEYRKVFLPKVELSFWVDDAREQEVIDKVVSIARTGQMGDGKVFVVPVADFTPITSAESE